MSYTWWGILKGMELLKEGIIWRVGDGEDSDVFADPWIPRGKLAKCARRTRLRRT
jgi:hypothetical protein